MEGFETFGQLQTAVAEFVRQRDWEQFHSPKNLTTAIAVEAAELMEILQWAGAEPDCSSEPRLGRIKEELADVLIYCASLANVMGLDLGELAKDKLESNCRRYTIEKARQVTRDLLE